MSAPRSVEDIYPCTPTQQGILFHCVASPGTNLYQIQYRQTLEGTLDPSLWKAAWEHVVRRHPVLRTGFAWQGQDKPMQVVHRDVSVELREEDLRSLGDGSSARLHKLVVEEWERELTLSQAPLFRLLLVRLADQRHQQIWTTHHLLIDGWSGELVQTEVLSCYEQLRRGQPISLPKAAPFRAFVAHLQKQDDAAAEHYWRECLKGFPSATDLGQDSGSAGLTSRQPYRRIGLSDPALMEALTRRGRSQQVTLHSILVAAWALVLARFSGSSDVLFGVGLSGRPPEVDGIERMAGVLMNTLPARFQIPWSARFRDWMHEVQTAQRQLLQFQLTPLPQVRGWSEVPRGLPLFETVFLFESYPSGSVSSDASVQVSSLEVSERTNYPLCVECDARGMLSLVFETDVVPETRARPLLDAYHAILKSIVRLPEGRVSDIAEMPNDERERLLLQQDATHQVTARRALLPQDFEELASREPDRIALTNAGSTLTYGQLNARADRIASQLQKNGAGAERIVGVAMERTADLVVALWGILKAGAAYLPLDPAYPRERLAFMVRDSGAQLVIADAAGAATLPEDITVLRIEDGEGSTAESERAETHPDQLAYVIYTSGSSGEPKGVMVPRGAVAQFFHGMDARVYSDGRGRVFAAVTSVSFDISVLELLWSLSRGFHVLLEPSLSESAAPAGPVQMSLFFFGAATPGSQDPYRLVLEGARFADAHGFEAVWTPERHFHAFGAHYPAPAVLSAAIATQTQRLQIRAGSVVSPLHHPLEIVEQWSVVDQLSKGRVGISLASGWHANDFVLAPEHFQGRRAKVSQDIETLRSLWRGEAIDAVAGDGATVQVRAFPRAVQPELPLWLTAAGSSETFRVAGELGVNILTHLLGQEVDELAAKIRVYREARRAAGHRSPGRVTLMVHTFVGENDDTVKALVHKPFTDYLRHSSDLMRARHREQEDADGPELEATIDNAFERYFASSALLGSEQKCITLGRQLARVGVDELGCLIDFGVEEEAVLGSLPRLENVRRALAASDASEPIATRWQKAGVTHCQCTPSLARVLLDSVAETGSPLQNLEVMMLGGEALPSEVATAVKEATGARLLNMYGPTETTVWSSVHEVAAPPYEAAVLPIGKPIANTRMYLVDSRGALVPVGVAGELCIGGAGVTRGYHRRPDLTAERFLPDPFSRIPGARMYQTGDRARWLLDGTLEFLGRSDDQVKIRGHRIELGEIEQALVADSAVASAAVAAWEPRAGEKSLVAFLVPAPGQALDVSRLRTELARTLPGYMVPRAFQQVDVLPLTPNGKLDRRALSHLKSNSSEVQESVAPGTPEEAVLVKVFQDVLRVPTVSVVANFFDLGGDSITALQVAARARKAGLAVTVGQIFEHPSVRDIARVAQKLVASSTRPAAQPPPPPPQQNPFADSGLSPDDLNRLMKRIP